MRPRVAITGVGLVTALGAAREESWRRMVAGECGIGPATVFDAAGYRSRIAAQVPMGEIDEPLKPVVTSGAAFRSDRIGLHPPPRRYRCGIASGERDAAGRISGEPGPRICCNERLSAWITPASNGTPSESGHFPSTRST